MSKESAKSCRCRYRYFKTFPMPILADADSMQKCLFLPIQMPTNRHIPSSLIVILERGWFIHLFVYICRSYRMVALKLCYNSMAQSTCTDDLSASAICHLQRFSSLVHKQAYIGFLLMVWWLFCNSSLYFAASWIQSMTLRQLTVRTSLPY